MKIFVVARIMKPAMAEITGVLLAAGFSTRYGSNKLLADIDGQPMISRSAYSLNACDRVIAVVQTGSVLIDELVKAGVECVVNPVPERGMGSSIACAVNATSTSDGWCILPADMPRVSPAITRQVANALINGAPLAAPVCQGQRGHPVGFSARFRDELTALDGDWGAREVLKRHTELLQVIDTSDKGVFYDIDTPGDMSVP